MPSFEVIYEEDEDVLEVTFATFDEHFARTIPLNDSIVLYTDTSVSHAWGITFYEYARLMQVTETHLDALEALDEANRNRLFSVLVKAPASYFLEILDTEGLRALVKAPRLQDLIGL